jgi:hypothetical protein
VALGVGALATVSASVVTRVVHLRGHARRVPASLPVEESEPGTAMGVA